MSIPLEPCALSEEFPTGLFVAESSAYFPVWEKIISCPCHKRQYVKAEDSFFLSSQCWYVFLRFPERETESLSRKGVVRKFWHSGDSLIKNLCQENRKFLRRISSLTGPLSSVKRSHSSKFFLRTHTCRGNGALHLHWQWHVERSAVCSPGFLLCLPSTELGCAPVSVPVRLRTRSRWGRCWASTWSSRRATGEERSSAASVQAFCPPASMVLRAAAETRLSAPLPRVKGSNCFILNSEQPKFKFKAFGYPLGWSWSPKHFYSLICTQQKLFQSFFFPLWWSVRLLGTYLGTATTRQ